MERCMKRTPPGLNVMLSLDERKRLNDFFVVLIVIDKRVAAKKRQDKKCPKVKNKCKEIGSPMRALFFMRNSFTVGYLNPYVNAHSKNATNDRHYSFHLKQGPLSYYAAG